MYKLADSFVFGVNRQFEPFCQQRPKHRPNFVFAGIGIFGLRDDIVQVGVYPARPAQHSNGLNIICLSDDLAQTGRVDMETYRG